MMNMTPKKPMPSKNKDKKGAPLPMPIRGSRTAKNKAKKK
jgi:hypothetical protein